MNLLEGTLVNSNAVTVTVLDWVAPMAVYVEPAVGDTVTVT